MLACQICKSQNLVPNGSFEIISTCPTAQNQLLFATPWQIPGNTSGTSDLFNGCNTTGFGAPANVAGYQYAHTGEGYAGFYTYGANDVREYIQVQLTSPLVSGFTYKVEMYVNPSENPGIAVDAIGIYISTGAVGGNGGYYLLPFTPQISNPTNSIISDTLNWTLVSGNYTALGGENYITIGNFVSDINTNISVFNSAGWGRGYYYVDDVSVSPATYINELAGQELINIYPNPFSNEINIIGNKNILEIVIYDISSRKLIQQPFSNTIKLNTEQLAKGIYLYEVRSKNSVVRKGKVVKQ